MIDDAAPPAPQVCRTSKNMYGPGEFEQYRAVDQYFEGRGDRERGSVRRSPAQQLGQQTPDHVLPSSEPHRGTTRGKHGTADAPITVQAESRGGVVLTGNRGFTFASSSYVTISGFSLRQRATLDIPTTCSQIRITRNDFQFSDIEGLNWLLVRGDNTKVDRNHFHGKSTLGVFLAIEGPGTDGMARGVYVLRNYFSDHTFAGDNGGEPIRLGLSGRSLSDAGAVVEQNLFERANGDPEAISVKSSSNTIRDNTIRNSFGGIVLRHGNRSRVEGNFILAGSNGIRIYGNDHLIVNNYMEKVSGSGIVLGSGNVRDHKVGDSAESRRGNDAPDRVTIALSTVLSSGIAISGESQRTLPRSVARSPTTSWLVTPASNSSRCRTCREPPGRATFAGGRHPTATSRTASAARTRCWQAARTASVG